MIGLGRMGGNMVRRLLRGGHECVVYARHPDAVQALAKDGSMRDAIFSSKEVVGTHGVYNFKQGDLYGGDQRARVIVKLENGQWKLAP
jgi:Trk K+ transport system NAD-binding subunit